MRVFSSSLATASALFVLASIGTVDHAVGQTQINSSGIPQAASSFPVEHGIVNLNNGVLHLELPIVNYGQRGSAQLPATLVYDSNIWKIANTEFYSTWETSATSPIGQTMTGGWYISYHALNQSIAPVQWGWISCQGTDYSTSIYSGISWNDQSGTEHIFPATIVTTTCTGTDGNSYVANTSATAYATDGSGYYAVVNNSQPGLYEKVTIYDRAGTLVASNSLNGAGSSLTEESWSNFGGVGLANGPLLPIDRNGNYPAYAASSIQDTLGRTLLTDSGIITQVGVGTVEYLDVPVAGGNTARYTINYETIPVLTSFGSPGVEEATDATIMVIASVVLPDGTSYQFTYNQGSYGDLASMTLPHGGQVFFTYSTAGTTANPPTRWVQSHTGSDGRTTFAWAQASTSQYSQAGTACGLVTNQVTTQSANNLYKFSNCSGNILLQEVDHGSATSSQLDAIDLYSYDTSHPCPTLGTSTVYHIGCTGLQWMNITGKTTVLPPVSGGSGTSLTTDIQYGYSNPGTGIPSSVKQWDYYAAAPTSLPDSPPGLPTRETDTTLGYSVNGALFPTLVNYEDATGSVVSSTNYTYDETAYMSGAAPTTTPNHSDALVTGNRGNLTTITKCCAWNGTSNVPLTSHVWYDDAGTVTAIQDANGKKTSLTAYDPTDTFPTTITLPATGSVSHVIEQTFDQNSGQLSSVTDENGQTTSYTFDQLGRPFQVKFSNAGNSVTLQTTTYPSANETDVSVLQASGVFLTASSITDGYGRPAQSIQEGISVETTYDSQGRLYSVTNAHAGTPSSTDGTAYFSHDELGRINSVKMPNTYSTIYSYAQNSVLVTDPLQHSRQITADSFGDTISVLEPNGAGNLAIATSYQYNWQGRLTYVSQQGGSVDSTQWRNRTFQYDGVGRLISQTTPEAGTMSLGYDNNGNLTSTQNQNTTNNTTQYYYDALNRITSAAIGGGPTYTYTYDAQDNSGDPYGKGRMTSTTNGSNVQTEWQHDPLGRSVSSAYCLPSDCTFDYKVQSVFDYQGNMTSLTYPDGRQVQWSYDQLNRPVSEMYASWNSIPVNTPYVSNISYYPAGQLQQASLGNGVQLGATYDPDQNLSSLVYVANGSPIVQKTYAWDKNAANLTSINDLAAGRTQSYGYDQLDRISLMADTGTTSNACNANLPTMPPASQSYSIDPWGNLQQSGTFSFSQLIGQNNQVEGYQYDSAGNQKQDANGNSYQYRADGLMTGSNGSTYTYDALGQRVRKDGSSSNEYIYLGGQLLAMRNPSTGVWTDRVYGPTGPLATVPGTQTGAPSFRISDHLGSLSYTLDASGNITGASSVLPYGQQTINTTSDNFVFTDHERDPENGSDATLYRHYASTQGRWLSPDPSNGSYNLLDPQSLNRYAYLANRPMAKTDRLGLDDGDFSFNGSDGDNGDDGDDGDSGWDGFWDDVGDWFGFGGGSGGSGHGGSGNHGVASPGPTGGIPSISAAAGTTQPGAGSATISMSLYYNGSTGVITGSWSVIDYSPGLDQDGMAEVPLIGVSYNGGGGSGPSNGGSGTSNAPNNGTFTKKYLPPGAQSCSAIFNFHAPPGFDLNAIIAAGRAGGANPFAALRAVGHGGTFDFQRSISGGNTTFYSGYTDASNIAVGAYLYGAGFSNGQASFISNSFANTMSSNAGSPQQSDYRNLGYDLANAGWNPSCH